jgi:hypothetical protein
MRGEHHASEGRRFPCGMISAGACKEITWRRNWIGSTFATTGGSKHSSGVQRSSI